MNYELEFKVFGDSKKLYDCFQPEILEGDRASVELKKEKEYLLFKIKAKDSIALRAIMNSISKLLTVHEKIKKI
jgi:tRNA threonylcarbamoyladenosine modification (KEOPS) complex  Pcc1 subunit